MSWSEWNNVGTITAQADAADYAPDVRDYNTIENVLADEKKVVFKVPIIIAEGLLSILDMLELRVRTDGDEDNENELLLMGAAGNDHYTPIVTLTAIQGTQIHSSGIYFADSIVSSDEAWLTETADIRQSSPNGEIARYALNLHRYDRFVIVCTSMAEATNTIYIDAKKA
jgi:hypothetical protein